MSTATQVSEAAYRPVPLECRVRVVTNMCDFPEKWPLTQSSFEMWVIGKLKNAGIPIKGTLCFRGIERGCITRFDDLESFGSIIWEWNPNVELRDRPLLACPA